MIRTGKIHRRNIVKIDEEKCDGCGACVPDCPEGAIQIVNGKAKLVNETNCDGLGACIGHCPRGAITIEQREALPYDERQVLQEILKKNDSETLLIKHIEHLKEHREWDYLKQAQSFLEQIKHPLAVRCEINVESKPSGCPGSRSMSFEPLRQNTHEETSTLKTPLRESRLRHWPLQLHLINPAASHYFRSNLLLTADCVPFAMASFHDEFLDGRTLAIACPKLDHGQEVYVEKIKRLIEEALVNTITVMIMEVPCCFGLLRLVQRAAAQSNRRIPIKLVVVSVRGKIIKEECIIQG